MMTLPELNTLQRLAEWIVPPDEKETIGGKAAIPYLMREIDTGAARAFLPALHAFLGKLNDAHFLTVTPDAQEKLILGYTTDPAFVRLAELINEGFYTSPEGMAMVGFTPLRMEAL